MERGDQRWVTPDRGVKRVMDVNGRGMCMAVTEGIYSLQEVNIEHHVNFIFMYQ